MTSGGWAIMIVAVGCMTVLLAWCVYKVLSTPGASQHMHSDKDIQPDDLDENSA